ERLFEAIIGSRLGLEFGEEGFWFEVIQYFSRQSMLDADHVGPLIDYIGFLRYGRPGLDGQVLEDIKMKGRSIAALMRGMEEWHQQLAEVRYSKKEKIKNWDRVPVKDFVKVFGSVKEKTYQRFELVQLSSYNELAREGRRMRHCVASYASSCASGRISIWSLRKYNLFGEETPLVTIELNMQGKRVVQVRGKCNRLADRRERRIVKEWAQQNRLVY
ncbi:MAG: PcfJ domain-containing protein, partial [Bacteroidota bacterium]